MEIKMINFKRIIIAGVFAATVLSACENQVKETENIETAQVTNKVIMASDIEWEMLNPARGDQSPKAATIWGDRNGSEPTGFLVKFVDGFSSPPHIHNVTYRALVLKGLIHNDDPSAEKMWMPAGSFWTQPAGESHITAARGKESIAYVEIDNSPYLVKPIEEAFDNGERPVNLHKKNIVWLDASKSTIIDKSSIQNPENGPKVAFLWESTELKGNFLKLPPGFKGKIISDGEIFRAIVVSGASEYKMPDTKEIKSLAPGSYFSSVGKSVHQISSKTGVESLVYIRTNGEFRVIKNQ